MNNYKTIGSVVLATVLVVGMTTWAYAQEGRWIGVI